MEYGNKSTTLITLYLHYVSLFRTINIQRAAIILYYFVFYFTQHVTHYSNHIICVLKNRFGHRGHFLSTKWAMFHKLASYFVCPGSNINQSDIECPVGQGKKAIQEPCSSTFSYLHYFLQITSSLRTRSDT